jgi:teichuronic acid biosynthesis glycosyltransferase TuaG
MNLVSIIMPYYKKRAYIKKSVLSILRQSYENFEVIIIYDDIDHSDISFINNIKKLDKRIKVIYNKKNIGAGPSRNVGISFAKGSIIAFLDCDDTWSHNKLNLQINFMSRKKADFSFTSYNLINCNSKKIGIRLAKPILTYQDLLSSCDIGLSTVMLKKKIINNYYKFPKLKTKEDYVLWLKLAKKKIVFHGMNIPLTQWRATNISLSANSIQKIFDAFLVYNKYMKFNFFKSCQSVFLLSLNYIIKKYL